RNHQLAHVFSCVERRGPNGRLSGGHGSPNAAQTPAPIGSIHRGGPADRDPPDPPPLELGAPARTVRGRGDDAGRSTLVSDPSDLRTRGRCASSTARGGARPASPSLWRTVSTTRMITRDIRRPSVRKAEARRPPTALVNPA